MGLLQVCFGLICKEGTKTSARGFGPFFSGVRVLDKGRRSNNNEQV